MSVEKQKVLIVDDAPENIEVLRQSLRSDYIVMAAINGEKALQIATNITSQPDIILLDIMLPGLDGYEVCKQLKANSATHEIPIIFITALNKSGHEAKGLELGAVDYISKPFEPILVKARVHNQLELKQHRDHLEDLVLERTKELALTQQVTIEAMGTLAEYRDPETGGHIKRTQAYIQVLAEYLSNNNKYKQYLTSDMIDKLYQVAPLHDIGKISVSDSILLKPGKLTELEFEEMKKHVQYGSDALRIAEKRLGSSSYFSLARELIENHHEKWDGSGYPNKRKGEEIPLSGRLMAIADVYDALISKRVYKPSMPHNKAKQIIIEGKGNHFDPEIVDAFISIEDKIKQIAKEFADHDEE
ncbi:MAG: response regulator [Pseudomonadota bacterium]